MQPVPKDIFGNTIKPGEFVVYRLSGRSGDLHYGKVTKVSFKQDNHGNPLCDKNGEPQFIIYVRQFQTNQWSRGPARSDSKLPKLDSMVVYPNIPKEVKDAFIRVGI
jgi:hypothetical protein